MPTLICPNCNYQTEGNELYCSKCGTKLQSVPEKALCKSCGAELKPDALFCAQCGAKCNDPEEIKCSKCGASLDEKDLFCPQCGAQNEVKQCSSSPSKSEEEIEQLYQNGMEDYYYKRYASAIEKLKKTAEQGHPKAQYFLSVCLGDREEAVTWKKKATENGIIDENAWDNPEELLAKAGQGDACAQYKIGMYYLHLYDNVGHFRHLCKDKDYRNNVMKWLRKAADQGYAPAQYELASVYHDIRFIPQSQLKEELQISISFWTNVNKKIDNLANDLIRSAAEKGHMGAVYRLAYCYQEGWYGLEKNTAKAFKLFCQAAKEYSFAAFEVGWCYEKGIGTSEDLKEASNWYQKAAELGFGYDRQKTNKDYMNRNMNRNWLSKLIFP